MAGVPVVVALVAGAGGGSHANDRDSGRPFAHNPTPSGEVRSNRPPRVLRLQAGPPRRANEGMEGGGWESGGGVIKTVSVPAAAADGGKSPPATGPATCTCGRDSGKPLAHNPEPSGENRSKRPPRALRLQAGPPRRSNEGME